MLILGPASTSLKSSVYDIRCNKDNGILSRSFKKQYE